MDVLRLNKAGVSMKSTHKAKSIPISEHQLEQLAKELETEEGIRRLGEDAYKEALAAERRKSINPGLLKH